MKHISLIIVVGILTAFCSGHLQAQEVSKPFSLEKTSRSPSDFHQFDNVKIKIAVDSVQAMGLGIRVTLTIKNETGKTITIFNPLNGLSMDIFNEAYQRVSVDEMKPMLWRGPGGKELPRNYRKVVIDRAQAGGRSIAESLSAENFTLASGQSIEVFYRITKTLRLNAGQSNSEDKEIAIQPGKYIVAASVSVAEYQEKVITPRFISYTMNPVFVQYGK